MPLFCVYEENRKPNYIILGRNCIILEIVYTENILVTINRLFEWPDHLVKVFILHGASQVVLMVKKPLDSAGDLRDAGSVLGSGRSPGGGHDNPLQYSCLENPMDRGAWGATVREVTKSRIRMKCLSAHTHYMAFKEHWPKGLLASATLILITKKQLKWNVYC